MKITKVLGVIALMGSLAGCSGAEPEPAQTVTLTATVPGPTVTKQVPGPTITVTATPTGEAGTEALALEGDVTEVFLAEYGRERWADDIIDVVRDGDRLIVRTKIVDPRGSDGSPEAAAALDVCRAALALLEAAGVGDPGVSVREADDTTFVVMGGNFPPTCTEV